MSSGRVWRFIYGSALVFACTAALHAQVRINEIFADNQTNRFSDGSISDWVELYNPTAQTISLASFSLTDATVTPRKWVFPNGASIAANSYLVVLLDPDRPASTTSSGTLNAGFGIKASGDRIELYSPTTQLVESVRFGPQAANYTIGRIPAGTGNFVLTRPTPNGGNVEQPLGGQSALRINEWMASPSSGSDWFELYNPGTLPVQLTGLYFTDNGNTPSPVAPLSYIGVGRYGFLQIFADNSTNDNEVDFGLGGGGDSINLFFANGTQIDRVQFGQQSSGVSQGRLPDGSGVIQTLNLATPGESNLILYEGIIVSEVLSHTDPPLEDAVEFYNRTDAPINIGGWYLSNARSDLKRYRIPDNTIIPARGFIVFYENQFGGASAATPFRFSSSQGDQVYLSPAVNDVLTGAIVEETFEASENAISFGRVETSVPGDYKFVALTSPTFGVNNPASVEQFRTGTGASNTAPRVGPLVISEIMYNPVSPDPLLDNTADEFIELLNISSSNVALFDPLFPTNRWILRGGVNFTFPQNAVIAPGAVVLVVSFDPADTAALNAFRSKFSVPQSVTVFGPYTGRLGNGGDEVELYKPDAPQGPGQNDEGFVPYIRVDKVNYADVAPWPANADGTGNSIQRRNMTAFGNDPINWMGAAPTAGVAGSPPAQLRITGISRPAGTTVALQFASVPGQSYTVEYLNDLGATGWNSLLNTNATSTSTTVQDTTTAGVRHRFYRVVGPVAN